MNRKRNEYTFEDAGASATARPELDWRDILGFLLERIWLILTVFVLVVLGGLIYTQHQIPVYSSSARILVEEDVSKVLNIGELVTASSRNIEYFNTHVKALHSRSMLQAAIKARGLDKKPFFLPGAGPDTDLADDSMKFVTIEAVPASRLIDIIVEHPRPDLASEFANGIADQYIEQNLNRRMETSMEAFEWLRRQTEEYRVKLEKGRLAMHEYRKETRTVSLEEHQDIVVGKLKAINAELTQAESVRRAAEAEWGKVRTAMADRAPLGQLACIAADELVKQAQSEVLKKQSQLAVLRTRYKDKHPQVAQAATELTGLESVYGNACRDAARCIESSYDLAREKEDGLRKALQDQEQKAFDLELKLVKYMEIKRNVEADQQVYDSILSRMKETKIAGDLRANNIRLVDAAKPSLEPCRPSWRRNVLNSMLIGLFLGVLMGLFIHFVDDRLRRTEDIELVLDVQVLSVIPRIESASLSLRARVVERDPHSGPSEAFRSLRASLALRPLGKKARRILITSTSAGEGKSLVAANLAIVFANDGQRTLLMDADLRRPSAHKLFEVADSDGLAAVLEDRASWEAAVRDSGIPNLSILNAGKVPHNPSELLGSAAMRQLLDALDARFDRIVVDCPPVFGVSDPLALLPSMEGVIFVVQFNRTGRRAAARALDKLREGNTPILGVVLNNVNLSRSSGYYYSYYHRHGYDKYYSRRSDGPARSPSV